MKKTFLLDTNVLLFDPLAIFKFATNIVHIPLICVEELDKFKKDQTENGRNARHFSRIVDDLRKRGQLAKGVPLNNGGTLFISAHPAHKSKVLEGLDLGRGDNLILANALFLKESGQTVILVTKDINLRLKADTVGVSSEDYGPKNMTLDELYSGQTSIPIARERLDTFQIEGLLSLTEDEKRDIYPNQYLIMVDKNNPHYRQLGRYSASKGGVVPLITKRDGVWGIFPKNLEQQFALDALLNDEVKLVSLVGKAGTGKTLLAIAAGLEMTLSKGLYTRVLVSRPIWPMGRDLGFLPGDVNDKLGPWMQPIFDILDFLFGHPREERQSKASWEELIKKGLLHIEPLTYIRGRSISSQFLIVDEAQNLTPHEIKTVITRAGEGSKIVLTGDCEQIDNPYLDSVNNGLTYCVERLKSEEIVAHSALKVGERSMLSEIASKLL